MEPARNRRRLCLWLCMLSGLLCARTATAYVDDIQESVEFRFQGAPPAAWRAGRSVLARFVPSPGAWVRAVSATGVREAALSDRLVVRMAGNAPVPEDVARRFGLRLARRVGGGLMILQAADPWDAAAAAHELAGRQGVEVATPVMRRKLALHGAFAPRPNDPYFHPGDASLVGQWHLENRDESGRPLGPDLDVRTAWAVSRGEGVVIGICDDGFEMNHPDLVAAAAGAPHYDFIRSRTVPTVNGSHSTCVAGLVGATGDNGLGVTGVAPAARLASLVIWDNVGDIASDEALLDMFQHRIDEVHVQNHSWGNADQNLLGPTALESAGLSNAVAHGRGGRGVVMVRSGGNGRENDSLGGNIRGDVNDDGYANDPRAIAVAAVRRDGRAASYSNPGACLLVSALSGDDSDRFAPTITLFTTDRVGSRGYNTVTTGGDRANYAYLGTGFSGTSGSAPLVSGVVALLLAANPMLGYRDVQQILAVSARHWDTTDPDLRANAAGFRISHNQGFGVADAGQAVQLAVGWSNRPPIETVSVRDAAVFRVPDDGLKLWVHQDAAEPRAVVCLPSLGPFADHPTGRLPLVDVGRAPAELTVDLRGKAALIERGDTFFKDKIGIAARAGAAFAVIYNNVNGDEVIVPGGTDYVPIPAVLIGENEGRALVQALQGGASVLGQLKTTAAVRTIEVTNRLICEHVGLRVKSNHPRRGDLRITLVSPSGTRSVLQRFNADTEPGPDDWTYWSVQHFYESSAGTWEVSFADGQPARVGDILELELIVRGVPIEDTDEDGLDDAWERRWFGDASHGPTEDADRDGNWNAREQLLGTDPTRPDAAFRLSVAPYDSGSVRLTWPANPYSEYRVMLRNRVGGADIEETRLQGLFPSLEWISPSDGAGNRFYRVEEIPH